MCSLAGRESGRKSSQRKLFTEKMGPQPDSPQSMRTYQLDQKGRKGRVMVGRAAKENPEEEEKTLVTAETVYVKAETQCCMKKMEDASSRC